MCLFYLYANAKLKIHICSNKHETGLVLRYYERRNVAFQLLFTIWPINFRFEKVYLNAILRKKRATLDFMNKIFKNKQTKKKKKIRLM